MTIDEIKEVLVGDEEMPPLLEDPENDSKPRRIALFVEPSPFALVIVITNHEGVPREFHGAKIIGSKSFPCPNVQQCSSFLALSPRIISEVAKFKPDIIHAPSPGIMVFSALAIAKMFSIPLIMSYHTHIPKYIPRYTWGWFVEPMWMVLRFLHRAADLTLVPSAAIIKDRIANNVTKAHKVRLWNKGVDSKSFHPRYYSNQMRARLSNGQLEKPLLIHVGRTGREKNLDFLKRIMDRLLGVRIAIIGDEPCRDELENIFAGMPAVFTGMLEGEELSQAYICQWGCFRETLGQVVLVSMSSGTPVVAAPAGGIPDIIPEEHEGKTSFLFTTGDLDDCVHKVQQLLSHGDLREAMAKAAREEMEKHDWGAATRLRESFAMRIIMQQSGSGRRTSLIFLDQSSPLPDGCSGHLKTLVVEVIQRQLC